MKRIFTLIVPILVLLCSSVSTALAQITVYGCPGKQVSLAFTPSDNGHTILSKLKISTTNTNQNFTDADNNSYTIDNTRGIITYTAKSGNDKIYIKALYAHKNSNNSTKDSNETYVLDLNSIALSDITVPENIEVGKPATIKVFSDIIDRGHLGSYTWFMSTDDGNTFTRVGAPSKDLYLESVPAGTLVFKVDFTTKEGVCYNSTSLTVSSDGVTPLPVEIISFTAQRSNQNVQLAWATAMEQNNLGFDVEVSEDGQRYRKLAFVPSQNGNAQHIQQYTYLDTENGKHGTRYYRLKQQDVDGKFEYFGVKTVNFAAASQHSLTLYPNPTTDGIVQLEVQATQNATMQVQVVNAVGKTVMTKDLSIAQGLSKEELVLEQSLPNGIYFVRTEIGGNVDTFRLLKK